MITFFLSLNCPSFSLKRDSSRFPFVQEARRRVEGFDNTVWSCGGQCGSWSPWSHPWCFWSQKIGVGKASTSDVVHSVVAPRDGWAQCWTVDGWNERANDRMNESLTGYISPDSLFGQPPAWREPEADWSSLCFGATTLFRWEKRGEATLPAGEVDVSGTGRAGTAVLLLVCRLWPHKPSALCRPLSICWM